MKLILRSPQPDPVLASSVIYRRRKTLRTARPHCVSVVVPTTSSKRRPVLAQLRSIATPAAPICACRCANHAGWRSRPRRPCSSSCAAIVPWPGRRPPGLSSLNSIRAEPSLEANQNASNRPDHFQPWARRNLFRLRPLSLPSKGITDKISSPTTRRNLRKSIPTTVALGMCCRRF